MSPTHPLTKRKSIIFQRFDRLVVQSKLGGVEGRMNWWCLCDCGNKVIANTRDLTAGRVRSCGCLRGTHKMSKTHPLYKVWLSMRERCNNPKCKSYPNYGGRGIKVDPLWSNFERFVADMGDRPPGHSLDRIDNDGDYAPDNCKWSTAQEQVLNSRRPRWVTVGGVTKTITGWAKQLGVSPATVTARINRYGWSEEKACTTPKTR